MAASPPARCGVSVRRRGDLRMPSPEQRILVIGYGACYFFVAPLCFLGGLWNSNPSAASIVGPLSPLATFALAVALGRERATRRKVLGMLLAISGPHFRNCRTVAEPLAASGVQNQ